MKLRTSLLIVLSLFMAGCKTTQTPSQQPQPTANTQPAESSAAASTEAQPVSNSNQAPEHAKSNDAENTDQTAQAPVEPQPQQSKSQESNGESCRLLLTYNISTENEGWSEVVTFSDKGVDIQDIDATIGYIDNKFVQIYPVIYKQFETFQSTYLKYYWDTWYIRDLTRESKDDALLFYYMPFSCHFSDISDLKTIYQISENPNFSLMESLNCTLEDRNDMPMRYHTSSNLYLVGNYLSIKYDIGYPTKQIMENGENQPLNDPLYFTTKINIKQGASIEYYFPQDNRLYSADYHTHQYDLFYYRNEEDFKYYFKYANYVTANIKMNHTIGYPYLNDQYKDTTLEKELGSPYIVLPIFYPGALDYLPIGLSQFQTLQEIEGQPLLDNYPPVFHVKSNAYISYFIEEYTFIQHTPPLMKEIMDDIITAPNGCGKFDWRKMEFTSHNQTYKPEVPYALSGIAWITTDDEVPLDKLIKQPQIVELKTVDLSYKLNNF